MRGNPNLSPVLIQQEIADTARRLREHTEGLSDMGTEAGEAETAYKVRFAQERIRFRARRIEAGAKSTVDEAEDHATIATQDEQLAYRISANAFRAATEATRATVGELSGLQSLLKYVEAQVSSGRPD